MVKFDGKKFRRMINYTKETSINLFLSIQSCYLRISGLRRDPHLYFISHAILPRCGGRSSEKLSRRQSEVDNPRV